MSAISAWSSMVVAGSHIRPPLDTDALTWAAAVVTAGGTVSAARKALISDFVWHEKKAGCWDLTDDYWILAAENETQALVSLKQLRTATTTESPTFTIDRGYAGNGTSNYVDTGFVPSTHSVAMAVTSARLATYEITNVAAAGCSAGCRTDAATTLSSIPRTGADVYNFGVVSDATTSGAVTDSRGFTAVRRLDSAGQVFKAFKNGGLGANAARTGAAALPAFSLYILARNNGGAAASFGARSVAFACIGAALSDAQEAAQYVNVQAWASAIGAAV